MSDDSDAAGSITPFVYEGPPDNEVKAPKEHVRLCRSDILRADVQIVRKGGDNNLHSHSGNDGFWFVLEGRVRFYGGEENKVIGEFGKHEGVFIPRDAPYWFESADGGELELLHVAAKDPRVQDRRTDYEPRKKRSKVAG